MSAGIDIRDAGVRYGEQVVLQSLDLSIGAGEFVCLVGPSGCGKSTLLRAVGGLVQIDGDIRIAGLPPEQAWSRLAYVFQQPRLLRWRHALGNVTLGMELRGVKGRREQLREKAREVLETVHLGELAQRRAHLLSGGEQQRVAIARALAVDPSVLLMDEPFSALDINTRAALRREIVSIWREVGLTILFVTHDVEEALVLASRVVVLSQKPTHIIADLAVSLPHPRDPEAGEFRALREKIVGHFGGMAQL